MTRRRPGPVPPYGYARAAPRQVSVSEAWRWAWSRIVAQPVVLAGLFVTLAIMLGNGIFVALGLVAMDQRVSAFRAIGASCSLVSRSQGLVGLIAVSILLYTVGLLTLVGWILLVPAQVLMVAYAYMRLTESQ